MTRDEWLCEEGLQITVPLQKFTYRVNGRDYIYDEILDAWVYGGGKDIVKHLSEIEKESYDPR